MARRKFARRDRSASWTRLFVFFDLPGGREEENMEFNGLWAWTENRLPAQAATSLGHVLAVPVTTGATFVTWWLKNRSCHMGVAQI